MRRIAAATAVLAATVAPIACGRTAPTARSTSVGQAHDWTPLAHAVHAKARWDSAVWYATAASQPVKVTLRRRSRRGSSSTAECIGRRENGGDYGRSSNPTHFGKYQYDRATWAAHGGNPAEWGTASPAEQERVFANGTARYGYSAWTPYDGC